MFRWVVWLELGVGDWGGLSQVVFRLVIILELIENCWEGWLGLFQFVGLFGRLPVFRGWRIEGLLLSVEEYYWRDLFQIAVHSVVLLELADVPRWIVESSVVIVGSYCWRNLVWLAVGLLILLEILENCFGDWQ